jgi:hypothetical protein
VKRRYVFVGEKRSRRAIAMGARWESGRLAARTLHDALREAGLEPAEQRYLNAFLDGEGWILDPAALATVRALADAGMPVIGMGRRVQAVLARAGVLHLALVHPAARGAIRARAAYQAHVAAVLNQRRPRRRLTATARATAA